MGTIRYGAKSPDQLRNRELEATSVQTWATTLTAVYETDPDAVAAVLPRPLTPSPEPLVRVTIATVDIGAGRPPFGAGTFSVEAPLTPDRKRTDFSKFDPVADLPVRKLRLIEFAERSSKQYGEIIRTVPGEWIRPFVHQRYDDLSVIGTD